MSLAYCRTNQLIYTGGHDGSLIAWNFETGYVKYYLHDYDASCMSKSGQYILEGKSVDCVIFHLTITIYIASHNVREKINALCNC